MILNDFNLNLRLSLESQQHEIARIKNAPVGAVLFSQNTWINSDVIETLIKRAHVSVAEHVEGSIVSWVKDG